MIEKELSYYEYWLSKDIWSAARAVIFLVSHHMFHKSWYENEDANDVTICFRKELRNKLKKDDAKHIFSKRHYMISGYDDKGDYSEGDVILEDSDVIPSKFLKWAYAKGYRLPYEFKLFIGVQEAPVPSTNKMEDSIAKEVVQGIAKTLWDIYPEMTIEEMLDHKAIKIYGGGKNYERDTTVRRWLSDVDPRKIKRGPKKKCK